jgi:hypothetical protein
MHVVWLDWFGAGKNNVMAKWCLDPCCFTPHPTHPLSWRRLNGTTTGKPRFLRMMCLQDARIHIVCGYHRPFSVFLVSALYLMSLLRRRKSSRDPYLWFRNSYAFTATMGDVAVDRTKSGVPRKEEVGGSKIRGPHWSLSQAYKILEVHLCNLIWQCQFPQKTMMILLTRRAE